MPEPFVGLMQKHNLSEAQCWVLYETSFNARPLDDLPGCARGLHEAVRSRSRPSKEYRDGLDELLRRGILQVINRESLGEIETLLREDPAIGPVAGLPMVGDVDFTTTGAALWHGGREPDCKYGCLVDRQSDERFVIYSGARGLLVKSLEEGFSDYVPIQPIEEIGVWRGRWWEKFPHGFRVAVKSMSG